MSTERNINGGKDDIPQRRQTSTLTNDNDPKDVKGDISQWWKSSTGTSLDGDKRQNRHTLTATNFKIDERQWNQTSKVT